MKKPSNWCAVVSLMLATVAVAGIALAQGPAPLPDIAPPSGLYSIVPIGDPAYGYVDTLLKVGIVVEYPDGTYGGRRAMTRYEFAVAIARLEPLIDPLPKGSHTPSALMTKMRRRLDGSRPAVEAYRSLVDEFTPELTLIGQDPTVIKTRLDLLDLKQLMEEVSAMKARLDGLEQQVSAIQAQEPRL